MKYKKRGFTIVELVIVIAVIAILAAVLVPTFSNMVLKAQRSADTQVVRMLNQYIGLDLAEGTKSKHDTMYDAIQACVRLGIEPDRISAKSDYNIAWESSTDHFVLLDTNAKKVMYPQNETTYSEYPIAGNELDYFMVTSYDERIENDASFKYSVYAYGNDWPSEITIHAGFDIGDVTGIEKINYTNNGEKKEVIIRTNSFQTNLEINGKLGLLDTGDTVRHYGPSGVVLINSIGSNSYYEFGVVGRLIIKKGHAVIGNYAEVFCLMENPINDNDVEPTTIEYYALVHNGDSSSSIHKEVVAKCEDGNHQKTKYISDNENIYEVCTTCGYTIKSGVAMDKTTAFSNFISDTSNHDVSHEHVFEKEEGSSIYKCECGLSYKKKYTVTIKTNNASNNTTFYAYCLKVYHVAAKDTNKLYKDKDGNYYTDYDYTSSNKAPYNQTDYDSLTGGLFFSSASPLFSDINLYYQKNQAYTYEVDSGDEIFIFEMPDNGGFHCIKSLTNGIETITSFDSIESSFCELVKNNTYFKNGNNSYNSGIKVTVTSDIVIEFDSMRHTG